jgi:hypothetical protein
MTLFVSSTSKDAMWGTLFKDGNAELNSWSLSSHKKSLNDPHPYPVLRLAVLGTHAHLLLKTGKVPLQIERLRSYKTMLS